MQRSQSPALSEFRQPSEGRPQAAREDASSPLDSSPRMVAQRRQIQSMFGPMNPAGSPASANGVLQGYFELNGQKTNDPDQFADNATKEEKEAQIWAVFKPAVEAAWKKLSDHHFTEGLVEEIRVGVMRRAFSSREATETVDDMALKLETEAAKRIRAAEKRKAEIVESGKPLTERDSPASVGGALSKTPTLAGKDKHTAATYKRTTPGVDSSAPTVTEETFSSDDYTKGPSKRARKNEPATTPTGTKQAWTKKLIDDSITAWPCEAPLARHLAQKVWPLLTDSDEGRKWEVKFREIDRLIEYRDGEAQSRTIEISKKSSGEKVKSLDRHDFNKRARQALKEAILAGTKHPAEQQGVLFYDELLRAAVNADVLGPAPAFSLKPAYTAAGEGGLSMILTHWRPILLFDWILAEDVLNNAS